MGLHQIDLRTEFKHQFSKQFNEESWCISELYFSFLRDYPTENVKKCSIHVSDNWGSQEYHYLSYPDYRGINLTIDLNKYFTLEKLDRKKVQLDLIHNGMLLIAEKEKWSTPPLTNAYKLCLDQELAYKFFVNSRLKSSPDRKRKVGIWCEWDIDFFKLFWVLFDKNGLEIKRDMIVLLEPSQGEMVYFIRCKWSDNKTVCIENKYRAQYAWLIDIGDIV